MSIRYLSGLSVDSTVLVVDAANDRVGIGTASPSVLLDVYNSSGWGGVDIDGTSGGEIRLQKNGTTYGNLYASDNSSTAFVINAAQANDLILQTNSSERLRITSAGNVGIGTTGPETILQVEQTIAGDAGGMLYLKNSTESSGTYTGIYFGTWGRKSGIFHKQGSYGGYGTGDLIFATNSALNGVVVSPSDARMTITNPGNVGIGTTAPTAMLNVANSGRALAVFRIQGTNRSTFYDNDFAVNNDGGGADGFIYGSNSAAGSFPFNGYGEVIIQANPRTGYSNGISFVTGTTSPNVKMRILEGGNVGIGTTAPSEKLELSASGNIYGKITSTTTGGNAGVRFLSTGAGEYGIFTDGDLRFYDFSASSERMRITSAGNVGIGTTNPANRRLVVSSNINDEWVGSFIHTGTNPYGLFVDTTANTSGGFTFAAYTFAGGGFYVRNSGNVLIGTSTDSGYKLDVSGTGRFSDNVTIQSGNSLFVNNANNTRSGFLRTSGNGTELSSFAGAGEPLILIAADTTSNMRFIVGGTTSGEERMRITSAGNVGIGTTSPSEILHVKSPGNNGGVWYTVFLGQNSTGYQNAFVARVQDELTDLGAGIVGTNTGSNLTFSTHPNGGVITERVRITKTGNVGIGTTAPAYTLDVQANTTSDPYVQARFLNTNNSGTEYAGILVNGTNQSHIRFLTGTSTWGGVGAKQWQIRSGIGANVDALSIYSWTLGSDVIYFNSSGNVGIGTTSPGAKLDVSGDINFSNTLKFGGVNVIHNGSTDVYGNIRVLYSASTLADGMYINYNSAGGGGAHLRFFANSTNERMRIDANSGNVGIGTTAPGEILEASRSTNGDIAIKVTNSNTGSSAAAQFFASNGTNQTQFFHTGTSYTGSGVLTSAAGLGGLYNATIQGLAFLAANASGAIKFATGTGNDERMRITSGGNVGIGTTAPYSTLTVGITDATAEISSGGPNTHLTLKTVGASGAIRFFTVGGTTSNLATTESMRIAAGGNVGIGTTAPASILHVSSTGANAYSSTITKGSNMKGIVNTLSNNADDMVGIYFGTGTDAAGSHWSGITGSRSNSAVNWGTQLNFYTHNDDLSNITDATQKMVIKDSGNVGIGTTGPVSTNLNSSLTIYKSYNGDTASVPSVTAQNYYENQSGLYLFGRNSGLTIVGADGENNEIVFANASSKDYAKIGTANGTTSAGGDMYFRTGGNVERMRITSAGNVGIGTSLPNYSLQVNSSTTITRLQITNSTTGTGAANGLQIIQDGSNATLSLKPSGFMSFETTNAERVRIDSSGNVGIGTTGPTEKLHVDGSTLITYNNSFQSTNSVGNKAILARVSPTSGIVNYAEYATATNLNGFVIGSDDARVKGNITGDSLEFITNTSTRMTVLSSGNVGINTTTPGSTLHVIGDVLIQTGALGVGVNPNATDGRIDASNDIVAFSTSDKRLKENITPIANALEKVRSLTGVEFDWKEETKSVHGYEGHDVGVIAQDVQAVLPEAVRTNDSGYLSVRYEKMIALLVEAMKEQQAQIDELKAQINDSSR